MSLPGLNCINMKTAFNMNNKRSTGERWGDSDKKAKLCWVWIRKITKEGPWRRCCRTNTIWRSSTNPMYLFLVNGRCHKRLASSDNRIRPLGALWTRNSIRLNLWQRSWKNLPICEVWPSFPSTCPCCCAPRHRLRLLWLSRVLPYRWKEPMPVEFKCFYGSPLEFLTTAKAVGVPAINFVYILAYKMFSFFKCRKYSDILTIYSRGHSTI